VEQQLEILWESISTFPPAPEQPPISSQSPLGHDKHEEDLQMSERFQDDVPDAALPNPEEPIPSITDRLSEVVPSIHLPESREEPSEEERIRQLEQALYQCQLYIDELKQMLIDQEFLEGQLATTEAFSHIQKQAIETFKLQAAEQRLLQDELDAAQQQVQSLNAEQSKVLTFAQQKETEFATLQLQMMQERAEMDRIKDKKAQVTAQLDALQGSLVQETQQRILAQKTAERLRTEQRNRDGAMQSLESRLAQAEEMLTHREAVIVALQERNKPDSQKDQFIQGISTTLLKAQHQITDLQRELSSQSILHAQLQHTAHELEQDTKVAQTRTEQLEQQVNDLQEQVLRQAQQASEYETAVQHWKTRCTEAEEWTSQVSQLWDELKAEAPIVNLSPDLTKTLTALSKWFQGSKGNTSGLEVQMTPKEFLGRRSRWQNL
jgi:chromosome segregation ATPase